MAWTRTNYYKHGSWNVVCDVCGFRFKSDQVKKRWDGLMTCNEDFETDHPQKYIRVRSNQRVVPFVRKEPEDQFIDVTYLDE